MTTGLISCACTPTHQIQKTPPPSPPHTPLISYTSNMARQRDFPPMSTSLIEKKKQLEILDLSAIQKISSGVRMGVVPYSDRLSR